MRAQDGETQLLTAAWKGHLEVVRALLEGGADVNQASKVRGCWMPIAVLAVSPTILCWKPAISCHLLIPQM